MKSSANRIAQLALFTFWTTYLPACESIDYGAIGSVSQAVTFPAANADWVPVEQAGLGLSDPDTDAQNNGRNIVGTSQYPAVFIAANDTTFMVRLRTNDSPTSGQNLSQYGWGIMFETDGDTSAYEYLLLANASGSNDVLNFLRNTTKTGGFLDDAETTLHSEAIVTTAGGNVKVSTADSSLFSGQDYFLDIGIPFSVLKAEGITLATPLRVIIGTSSNGTRLSEDLGGTSSTPATATYSSVLSDTTFIDGQPGDLDGDTVINTTDIDNDNDGIRDTAENSLGVDPDADHDSDGIPNWKDKSDTGAGASSGCTDSASDGVCDTLDTAFDADSDGVANHNDVDSDNDGIIDLLEAGHGGTDANGDGLVDSPYGTNGLANALETGTDSGTVNYVLLDTDGDTTKDIYDLDSDADTTKDVSEAGLGSLDANDNGRLDSTTDADDDGLMDPTAVDANAALFGHPALTLPDTDNDDIPDPYDFDDGGPGVGDSDSDTYSDSTECASGWPCPDGNRDGVPNYMVATVDTDGDGVDNGDDDAINDPYDCLDSDSDSCDDCSQTGANHSGGDTSNDGADADSDGICDLTDDSDSDGVVDATDTNRTNSSICRDVDADSCDDCAVVHTGGGSTSNDGDDADSDGICDATDDSDGDGVVDATDTNRTSASFCRDVDTDSCDDCTNVHTGGGSTSNDGTDADSDGLCDLGDDSDGDGVVDATDTNRTNSSICRDVDSDGCDDCSVVQTGGGSTSNDGNDADSDGICDATDDSDGDGVVDATDLNRTSSSICRDVDADSCDDCAVVHTGGGSTSNDGTDSDSDGLCDLGDDSDGDGVVDATDLARTNSSICRDVDADSCDDCTNVHTGGGSTSNDGNDADSDGICDATDDSDGDGVVDATDLARTNSSICRDVDTDGCDDCAVVHTGGGSTSNDGNDADSDGTCDLSDDSDSDGVVDATDTNRTNSSICRDVDTDGCDDCSVVHTGGGSTTNDGADADSDGICDATDDSDGDGVVDATDLARTNSSICRDVDADSCDDCAVVQTGGGSTSNDGNDADSDGICDATDDSDGDGVVDATDLARTNSSICQDVDADSCDDCAVVHTGGGSTSNDGNDADSDGTCDLSDDSDSDGVVDATDLARTNSSICQDVDADSCDDCAVVHTGGGSTSNDGNDADSDGICDATDDSDGDGVVDATDLARTNSSICQDVDSDTCDDCTNVHTGGGSTSNDGNDADSDGTCDLSDDSDSDGIVDATDLARTDSSICRDVDSDTCDDCTNVHTGGGSTSNDGNDADSDGTCDLSDDSDSDGVVDATDINRTNSSICRDVDSDTCDDCSVVHTGGGSTSNDGADADSDGICDVTDDSDNDGVVDATDTNRTNSSICRDVDSDTCDDCSVVHTGGGSTSNDGADADSDGTCDVTDDSDNDGVVDATDLARTNSSICQDVDSDTCDDCAVVHTGGGSTSNDGADTDHNGICDLGETADLDGDGTRDVSDADIDGDGIPNATEGALDTDNDGLISSRDLDADGDGLLDTVEAGLADLDEDLDGRIDDTDDVDDDGLPAVADANDGDAQVTTSNWTPLNSDETGEPDFLDLDSDDDGIVDAIEGYDYDGDGDADVTPAPADVNNDGVDDAYFAWLGGHTDTELPNHDIDNLPDYRDVDDDDDGIDTADECVDAEVGCEDADNDYIPDYLDPAEPTPDAGAPTSDTSSEVNVTSEQPTTSAPPSEDTSAEVPTTSAETPTTSEETPTTSAEVPTTSAETPTTSEEPTPTSEGPISTSEVTSTPVVPTSETPDESTSQVPTPTTDVVTSEAPTTGPVVDTSSSAEPTGAPLTDDNPPVDASDDTSAPVTSSESFTTSSEPETTDAGAPLDAGTDTCDETTYEGCADTDRDGVPDFIECPDSADVCPDTDGDGTPDYRDTDDDGDGIRTRVEIERGDTDHDGILDYEDTDDDGDGVPSSEEINSRDLDRDGVPDAIDPDEIGFAGGAGCSVQHRGSSSNLGWTLTLVMAAAVTLARRRRVSRGAVVASTCLAVASVSSESGAQEVTSRFQLNRYHPAPLVQDGFAANRATALGAGNWSLGFQLDYSHDPLVVESPAGSADAERYSLIGTEVVGNLGFAVGLGDRWTPFVNVPVVLALSGERVDGLPAGDGATLGNPNLGTRVLIAGSAETQAHFSAQLGVELPLSAAISDTQSFVGSNGVTFAPQLIGDVETDSLVWSLSVGARLPTTKTPLFNVTLQHEGTAVLGAALPVGDSFSAHAEVFASTFLNDAFSRSTTAIEGLLGAKLAPTQSLKLGGAIGTGFTRGIGEPDVRAILSAGFTHFAPEVAAPPTPPPPTHPADTDGDGLTDPVDACPAEPEDVDQFEDSNGCPEPDNDADAVLDAQDKCPLEAEDRDTFADEDGCPDPDNDADAVLDAQDKCPQEPGTVELAGCPIPDGDKDAVPDATDACPTEPGVTEYNGCKTKQLVQVTGEKIELLDRVYFETNKDVILPQSFPLLENVASVLTAHPELTKVVVEGHTDNAGNKAKNQKLSHKRAEAVVTFLVARGVAADRLSAQGFGQDKPIADNKTTEGRATNRRVEFRISSKAP